MKKVTSLHYGTIFKKAFSDIEICTAFVQAILGIKIEVEKVEMEKAFEKKYGPITPRFDLYAEDLKNRVIVDIQHERLSDHYARFLYYHLVAILEQSVKSDDYQPALTVYTIVVLTSVDRHKKDVAAIKMGQPPLVEVHRQQLEAELPELLAKKPRKNVITVRLLPKERKWSLNCR